MSEPRQARLRILDRTALAEAIRQLLGDFGDSQRLASQETSIPQSQLSRMLSQELGEMGLKQFHQLSKAVREERRPQFLAAFFYPETVTRYVAYLQWIATESASLREVPKDYWALPFEGPTRMDPNQWPWPQQPYEDDLAQVVEYWEQKCPASYNRFHREMDKLGIPPDRKQLAMLRMLVPLLDARASAFVERNWEDLDREEFETFADAGLKRELIILKRSAPLQRLQQLGPWVVGD